MSDLPSNQSTTITAGDNITIVFTETEGDYWDIEISGTGGGVTDHGDLTGLTDDDHSQYRLESADHTHQSTGLQGGTLDHGLALTGLTDDDHTQYLKESVLSEANAVDLTDGGETALHSHAGSGSTIDVQEEGVLELAASALNFDGDDFDIADAGGGVAAIDVAATHAGSTHSAATDTHIADAADAHDASAISIADAGNDFTATDVEGALDELQADNEAHVAAADPHTGYRLESADHTHQSTGAQAGQLDHGLALTGLTDDDHTQYRLESADHTHQSTGLQGGTLDHGAALTGLTDDDHTQYVLESLVDAKGDIIAASAADTPARLAVGANDTILMADSGETTGLRWQAPAGTAEIADIADAEAAGTSDTWARGDHVHSGGIYRKESESGTFTVGAFFDGNGSTLTTGVRPIWRAPFDCTVTQVRGYVDTGTTTVINAGTGAASGEDFCSANITIDPADAWEAGTVNQNTAVTSGETVSVEIVTAGTATQLTIQIEFTRP